MRSETVEDRYLARAFGLAGGCVTVVAAALCTAAAVPPERIGVRVAVMAATVGVLARVLADWRACVGVAVVAALIYVGFLVHRDGVLTGDLSAWPYALTIGAAAILGRVIRPHS
jgi:hypothetical protein